MTVRALMRCTHITEFEQSMEVNMACCYERGANSDFCEATPSGSFKIMVTKGYPAAKQFEVGEKYYIDISDVSQ